MISLESITPMLGNRPNISSASVELLSPSGEGDHALIHFPPTSAGSSSPSQLDGLTLATIVAKLLTAASTALNGDRAYLEEFLTRAARLIRAELDHQHRDTISGRASEQPLAPWQIQKLVEFIDTHLSEKIRITDLARMTRLSNGHLSRSFRSVFHLPPYAYIIHRRIRRAQELMMLTDEPLASVAASSGFADQAHFTRLFRRAVGTSPGSWRQLRRAQVRTTTRSGPRGCEEEPFAEENVDISLRFGGAAANLDTSA
jgi:AraC family transcriptional regulator